MVESDHCPISVRRQRTVLGVHRSSFYYQGIPESQENLKLMKRIDQLYLDVGGRLRTRSIERTVEFWDWQANDGRPIFWLMNSVDGRL